MFNYTIKINEDCDFDREINDIHSKIYNSKMDNDDKNIIYNQILNSINQYKGHIINNGGKHFSMNRIFQGKGFKIKVIIYNKKKTFFDKIFNIFGS